MYCYPGNSSSSWATIRDLYDRYGEEYVDKLAIRRNWNETAGSYVSDESREGKFRVICLALEDSKALIRRKLLCKYTSIEGLDSANFLGIKQWHIKLTIETLKIGGDCTSCECNADLDKFIDCNSICTEDGVCLTSNKTFMVATVAHYPCEGCGDGCSCCR